LCNPISGESKVAKTNPTTQAYAELQSAWVHYNRELFGGKLPPCLITMQREKRTYGYFSSQRFVHRHDKSKTDEIAINPSYFAVVPLLEILQTLVHEMTHQWQSHFGEPGRRTYHNREWSEKMESIGLMPSSTGQPGGAKTGEKMADYPIAGGAFMSATDALLKKNFAVSWLDRMPPAGPLGAVAGGKLSGLALTLGALLTPAPPGNRSNRVKYRCPSCSAQLWGKPSLRVLCGVEKCRRAEFEPVE
jgi:predicted SprT family Zn-dependent metalloprotease